jgi:integral membrane protein
VTFVRALRSLAIIEGISTLILFGVAMPLKYFAGMPLAVRIVGSLHGALFVALLLMLLVAIRKVPISLGVAAAGIVAAIIPGGPFFLDRHLARYDASRGGALRTDPADARTAASPRPFGEKSRPGKK